MGIRRELVEWLVKINAGDAAAKIDDVAKRAQFLKNEAAKVEKSLDSVGGTGKKVASLLGGPMATLGDVVFELSGHASSAGGAMGALGATAAGAVVGVAALTYAGVQLAASAVEAVKRLEEQGLAGEIPAATRESVEDYERNVQSLRNEVDLATVSIGSGAVEAVANLSAALVGLSRSVGDTVGSVTDLVKRMQDLSTTMLDLMTGSWIGDLLKSAPGELGEMARSGEGVIGMIANWDGAATELNAVLQEQVDKGEEVAASQEKVKKAYDANKAAAKEYAAELRKLAEEEAKRAAAARDAALEAVSASLRAQALADVGLHVTGARVTGTTEAAAGAQAAVRVTQIPTVVVSEVAGPTGADVRGTREDRRTATTAAINDTASALGGGVDGVTSLLAAAGPIGAAIGASLNLGSITDSLDGLVDGLMSAITDLPSILTRLLSEVVPSILSSLPDLAGALVEAVVQLPAILIAALPEILKAQVMALVELPVQIASALWDALRDLPQLIWEGLKDLFNGIFKDKEGRVLGTDLRGAKGERSLFGARFDSGSREITRTGMALLHRGEEVRRRAYRGPTTGGGHTINVYGPDTREVVREIRTLLGGDYGYAYGTGDSL